MTDGTQHRIVAGVDGSPASRAALRWAADQAALSNATVEAVLAWHPPAWAGWEPGILDDNIEDNFRSFLDQVIEEELGQQRSVPVHQQVLQGNAARMLLERSRGAILLVTGTRGHGGFTGMLLGSVSQHCSQHATCPIVIVPNPDR